MTEHEEIMETVKKNLLEDLKGASTTNCGAFADAWGQNIIDYLNTLGYEAEYHVGEGVIDFSFKPKEYNDNVR